MNHRVFFVAVALASSALVGCGDKTTAKAESTAKASAAPTASGKPAATTTATSSSGW